MNDNARRPLAIVALSGGMDSCVAAAITAQTSELALLHVTYGQRTARRNTRLLGTGQNVRTKATQLRLEEAGGAVGQVGAKRVAAYQLGEFAGRVGRGGVVGTHLVQGDIYTPLSGLPGRFTPGEATADNSERQCSHDMGSPSEPMSNFSARSYPPHGSAKTVTFVK